MVNKRTHRRNLHRGLTLLELILALALSVLVLMAIGMAIDIHYRMFDVRRTSIEETHVARAVLRSIADDLRTAVQYVPPDLSGLETVTSNTASAAASMAANAASNAQGSVGSTLPTSFGNPTSSGGNSTSANNPNTPTATTQSTPPQNVQTTMGPAQSTGSRATSQTGGAGTSGMQGFGNMASGAAGGMSLPSGFGTGGASGSTSAGGAAAGTGEETSELGTPIAIVGLYGSSGTLQFDMSRLPRVDEYEALYSANSELGVVDIPSDIKTVTYFVCSEDTFDAARSPTLMNGSPQPSASGRGRGLMRRELSQAVSSWAEANGNLNATYSDAKLLAEEVTGLQFRYYDGEDWLDDWNSDDLGGLPRAVEITVTIQPTFGMSEQELSDLSADEAPAEKTYSLIVHLPAAQAAAASTMVEDTAAGDSAVLQEAMP